MKVILNNGETYDIDRIVIRVNGKAHVIPMDQVKEIVQHFK